MGNGFQCRGTKCIPGRNVPSHRDRPLPRQATDAPLGLTGGGPGFARPWVGRWLHLGMSPLGHRPFVCGSTIMLCSGLRLALFAGAQSAPLRENPLSSYPCPLPRKAIVPAPDRPWDVRAPSRPGEDLHPKVPGFTRHVQKPLAGKAPGRSRIVSKEGEALEGVTSELLWVT
jgi:hypothetical protein